LFLEGCRTFLEPKIGWTDVQVEVDYPNKDGKTESVPPWLDLKVMAQYDPINPMKVWTLIREALNLRTTDDDGDLAGAKAQLWEWATRPLISHVSEATHFGNLLGSLLLILGDLAVKTEKPKEDPNHAVFKASGGGINLTLIATPDQRSIRVENVSRVFNPT
jgi:hypothetical protein